MEKLKLIWFLIKASIHFIYVLLSTFLGFKHTYHLSFTKEDDGEWYIDFPNWPFAHGNLMMVAGADKLCETLSHNTNHTKVKVITSNHEIASVEDSGAIRCDRVWAYLEYGGQYYLPKFNNLDFADLWLCQVTLFVIGWWPKYIYVIDESDN